MKLYQPETYTPKEDCNGCGTDGWSAKLIPNTIYFVSIKESCCIHDHMYSVGQTIEDKKLADRVFLNNMLRIINNIDKWYYPTRLARHRAKKYYNAVKYFGGASFWNSKS